MSQVISNRLWSYQQAYLEAKKADRFWALPTFAQKQGSRSGQISTFYNSASANLFSAIWIFCLSRWSWRRRCSNLLLATILLPLVMGRPIVEGLSGPTPPKFLSRTRQEFWRFLAGLSLRTSGACDGHAVISAQRFLRISVGRRSVGRSPGRYRSR